MQWFSHLTAYKKDSNQLAFLSTILDPAVLCGALSDEKLLWEDRSSKWLLCGALSEEA